VDEWESARIRRAVAKQHGVAWEDVEWEASTDQFRVLDPGADSQVLATYALSPDASYLLRIDAPAAHLDVEDLELWRPPRRASDSDNSDNSYQPDVTPGRDDASPSPRSSLQRRSRTPIAVLGCTYALLLVVDFGLALSLDPPRYVAVAAIVAAVLSVVAGGLGAAVALYLRRS
jgi:hypothetical protein